MSFIFLTKTVYASGESSLLGSPDALNVAQNYYPNLTQHSEVKTK